MSDLKTPPAPETPKPGEPPVVPQTPVPEAKPPVVPETKPPETPKVEPKPGEPVKPQVPEKYDLKLKAGSKLGAEHLEKISAYAKAKGLSNEDAQALLDHDQENFSSFETAQTAALEKAKEEWKTLSQADAEIGGQNLPQSVDLSRRVVQRFGDAEFQQFLDDSGLGNHPAMLRFATRIGKLMTADQLVVPPAQPVGGTKKDPAHAMYPNNP